MYKTYTVSPTEATEALRDHYGVDEVKIVDTLFVFTPASLLDAFGVMRKAFVENASLGSTAKIPMIRELRSWANKHDKPGTTSLGLGEAKTIVEAYLSLLNK